MTELRRRCEISGWISELVNALTGRWELERLVVGS